MSLIDGDIGFKFLSKKTLVKLLNELDDDVVLWPNNVGNLSIFKIKDEKFVVNVGQIDFLLEGEIEYVNN